MAYLKIKSRRITLITPLQNPHPAIVIYIFYLSAMAKRKSLISFVVLALFSSCVHALLLVPQADHFNTNTIQTSPPDSAMAYARAPIRARGRGRAFAFRGGRGGPKGGRNAVEIVPQPPRDGGSPIVPHMSTLHDAKSTTDDTIVTFTRVRPMHPHRTASP
jgi:hypothetical protein